jgi:hypothetical protein
MGHRNRILLSTSFILFSSLTVFAGSARAQSTGEEAAKPADDAAKAAPAAEEKAAHPVAEAAKPAEAAPPAAEPAPAPAPSPPAEPVVEWKVQSKGGMLMTSGNSSSKNYTVGLNAFRKEGNNKLSLEGGLAYGKTSVLTATTGPDGTTTVGRQETTSTNNMAAKGRYDRFLTEHNTTYASGQAAADKIAGKSFFGGGQIGYSRLLVKDTLNLLVAELGYDFSYERYVQPEGSAASLDPVAIHSARVMVGETLSLTKETGITASVEALFNLNKETKAVDAKSKDGSLGVAAFKDTRVNAKVGLSTNLWKSLSFGFSFALKYDQNPAPRPAPKGVAYAYAKDDPDYFSNKVDTITEATLLYTFF